MNFESYSLQSSLHIDVDFGSFYWLAGRYFKCWPCNRTFKWKGSLTRHMARHHADQEGVSYFSFQYTGPGVKYFSFHVLRAGGVISPFLCAEAHSCDFRSSNRRCVWFRSVFGHFTCILKGIDRVSFCFWVLCVLQESDVDLETH